MYTERIQHEFGPSEGALDASLGTAKMRFMPACRTNPVSRTSPGYIGYMSDRPLLSQRLSGCLPIVGSGDIRCVHPSSAIHVHSGAVVTENNAHALTCLLRLVRRQFWILTSSRLRSNSAGTLSLQTQNRVLFPAPSITARCIFFFFRFLGFWGRLRESGPTRSRIRKSASLRLWCETCSPPNLRGGGMNLECARQLTTQLTTWMQRDFQGLYGSPHTLQLHLTLALVFDALRLPGLLLSGDKGVNDSKHIGVEAAYARTDRVRADHALQLLMGKQVADVLSRTAVKEDDGCEEGIADNNEPASGADATLATPAARTLAPKAERQETRQPATTAAALCCSPASAARS